MFAGRGGHASCNYIQFVLHDWLISKCNMMGGWTCPHVVRVAGSSGADAEMC